MVGSRLVFSEILIADRASSSLDPGDHIYTFPVAADFLTARAADYVATTVTKLAGDCTPTAGVSMLRYTGQTSLTDVFFLRDVTSTGIHFGLTPAYWNLNYDNCSQGANLNRKPGLIFVR